MRWGDEGDSGRESEGEEEEEETRRILFALFLPPTFVHPAAFPAFPDSEFLASGFVMADRRRKTDNHYRGAARHLRARVRRPAHATGRRPNDVTPRECGTVMP